MRLASLVATTMFLAASAASAFAAEAPPSPTPINPRAIAGEVAQAVDDAYFDPAKAHKIAEGLRAQAQSGAFDRLSNPLDLAAALSAWLHPFDGHFVVMHRPNADPPGGPRHGGPGMGPDSLLARQNYGFARTEMLPGGIGYIAVTQFAPIDARSPTDPSRMAADAALQSVAGARALVLDLRDSRGGDSAMVAYLASYFVPAKADIFNTFHTRGESGSEAPIVDPTGPRRLDTPLYILVNGGSGSASESLPYTLQAARRATIVGEPTNGRANPGGLMRMSNGFSVFVSNGSPENPITHSNWEGTGVKPDVAVASADALRRAQELALQALLAADPKGPGAAELRWLLDDMHATPAALGAQALQAYVGNYGGEASITMTTSEGGAFLVLHQGRRAAMLRALGADLFASALDPLVHAQFERVDGRVIAVTLMTPAGAVARFTRTPS